MLVYKVRPFVVKIIELLVEKTLPTIDCGSVIFSSVKNGVKLEVQFVSYSSSDNNYGHIPIVRFDGSCINLNLAEELALKEAFKKIEGKLIEDRDRPAKLIEEWFNAS